MKKKTTTSKSDLATVPHKAGFPPNRQNKEHKQKQPMFYKN